jgi:hypothetical protein
MAMLAALLVPRTVRGTESVAKKPANVRVKAVGLVLLAIVRALDYANTVVHAI